MTYEPYWYGVNITAHTYSVSLYDDVVPHTEAACDKELSNNVNAIRYF